MNVPASPPHPQAVDAPLTRHAVFLVCTIGRGHADADRARETLAGIGDLLKTVGFRDPAARLSCTAAVGSDAWPRVMRMPAPAELHPFRPVSGAVHAAVATPGDLLFHIRADRADLCFELERLLLDALGSSVAVADEVQGFRYLDARDLLGFVDGTANPTGWELPDATLVGDEDPDARGGSYVVVQKYLHDLAAWESLDTATQEAVIGRRKADGVELPDATSGQKSHKTLATIADGDGEHPILRDNMPFGRPGAREFGTYFIGYSRRLEVIERMLQRMFVGDPPGLHDRILDVSRAVTGGVFFAPAATALDALAE